MKKIFNMSISSPTKKSDQEVYVICAELLEITAKAYKKITDPIKRKEYEEYLNRQVKFLEELQKRIDTHDYSKEDEHHWRMERFWQKVHSKQLSPGGG